MTNINSRIIHARLKTWPMLIKFYPEAANWRCAGPFPSADAVIIPYLGKMVPLKQRWIDNGNFYYEISGTSGIIVLPEWIDCFETDELIPLGGYDEEYGKSHEFSILQHHDISTRCQAADSVIIILW
jgi:hypothetical protein